MKRIFACFIAIIAAVCMTRSASAQTNSATDSIIKVEIKVTNLHCNNDMPTIKKMLLNQEGIDEVTYTEIASETSMFTIMYHSSVISQAQVEKAIEATPGCDNKDETPYRVKKEGTRKKGKS